MPLPPEFFRALPQRSTASLTDILAAPAEYEAEAVSAATLELKKRGVAGETLTAQIAPKVEAIKITQAAANEPLEWPMRMLCALVPLLSIRLAMSYRNRGQVTKCDDCFTCAVAGVVIYVVIAALDALLRKL